MFTLFSHAFRRNRLLVVLSLIPLIFSITILLRKSNLTNVNSAIVSLIYIVELIPVHFTIVTLLCLEYARTTQKHLEESIAVISESFAQTTMWMTLVMEIYIALFFFSHLIIIFIVTFLTSGFEPQLLLHSTRISLVYYLLLPQVAMILGFLLSRVKRMISAYFLLLFFIFLFSSQSKEVIYQLYRGENTWLYRVMETTRIWPQTDWINYAYGVPVENSVITNVLLWLLIFVAAYFTSLLKLQQSRILKRICISFMIFALSVGFLSLRPSSKLLTGSTSPHLGGGHDQYFYYHEQDEIWNSPSNLVITDMRLDIGVHRQLEARVILNYQTDDGMEAQPTFTLYHGYKVDGIRDSQQNLIGFTQKNDYLTLHESLPSEGELEFQYTGHGNRYYSNDQGIFLPANFIFYPIPGHVHVWDDTTGGFLPFVPSQPINYTVNIQYDRPIYSNLEQKEDNYWKGSARSLTILSGLFREETYNDVQYVSPYGFSTLDSEWSSYQTVIEADDEAWQAEAQQATFVAQTPSVNQGGAYEAVFISNDQVLFRSPVHLDTFGNAYDVDPKKYQLQTVLNDLSNDDPYMYESHLAIQTQSVGYSDEEKANLESVPARSQFYARTEQLRKIWTDKEIIERFEYFIEDASDQRTIENFFDDLEAEAKDTTDD